jgi:sporulation protein YlmC with PRC-barrel domain
MRASLISTLLLSTLLVPAAMAQGMIAGTPAAPPASDRIAASGEAPDPIRFITRRDPWVVRATHLLGERVYDAGGEAVGEVEDVLINRNGRVEALVIEAGGFLGIGERRIAVPPRAIRFVPYEMTATTGTIPSAGLPTDTPAAAETRNDHRIRKTIVPERMVLTIPVDHLRNAPAFLEDQ